MSISTLLSVRGVVVSGCGSVSGGSRKHSLVLVRIPSVRLNVRGGRITTCAAPCESLEVVEKVGVRGVAFECSVLQCVKEGLVFQEARTPELIRVAAYLRALSFYTYLEGHTEEALKLHCKMKTDDEFIALTSKVAGLEQGYKRIVCILALYPVSCLDDRSIVDLHPALRVTFSGEEHVLVGSLDLNQGRILPGYPSRLRFLARSTCL